MTAMAGSGSSPTWSITTQIPGYDTTPGVGLVKGVTVGFTVNGSVQGSVFVPDTQFTVENVRAAVSAEASKLAAIQALTHQSPPAGP